MADERPLTEQVAYVVGHMNEDHRDALVLYCRAFTDLPETRSVTMTGVDRSGFDMVARTSSGDRAVRLTFERELTTVHDAEVALIDLVRRAKAVLDGDSKV